MMTSTHRPRRHFLLSIICICTLLVNLSECRKTKKSKTKLDWWQTQVLYQIYPRSFKDSNADGIGDLNGVYEKLQYIKDLGVGGIWFSPIYSSPMVDFGYDISNYRKISSIFGSMNDFDRVLRKAHSLGLKILMDFVPNHTSHKHDWFQKSIKRIAPYTDYYIWKDAKYMNGKRSPPNNWLSMFGGGAWEWNEERGQYYLHQFATAQPDLDYRNPVVYEEMKNVLIFWLDKGVDGFRVDAINFAYEDSSFPDEPRTYTPFVNEDEEKYLKHIYSQDQPETYELVKDWRKLLDAYSNKEDGRTRFMMTEGYTAIDMVMKYYGTPENPGANFPFNFLFIDTINADSNATIIRREINNWFDHLPQGQWSNWVIGNHDNSRAATRFGQYLLDGLHMLQMLLPGTVIVYNGDELGMEDTYIRWGQTVDPRGVNSGPGRYKMFSRDPERCPFQWDDSENAGFTTSLLTWLPVNPGYWKANVISESQNTTRITHLQIFKELVALRRNIVFQKGDLHMYELSEWVLAMARTYVDHATYIVVINLGSEITISNLKIQRQSLPYKVKVLIPSVNSNYKIGDVISTAAIKLRPKAAVVLTTSEEDWDVPLSANSKIHLKYDVL